MTAATAEATFKRNRERQIRKFDKFMHKEKLRTAPHDATRTTGNTEPIDKQKWIVNMSKHQLSEEETSVLEKGLNFAPALSRVPVAEIIAGVEPALRKHRDDAEADRARAAVSNILRKAKAPKPNTTKKERQALKDLRSNKDIVIVQADKGNATVIMNTDDYEKKALAILRNAPFTKLQRDPTKKTERELNERLRSFLTQGNLTKAEYDTLRTSEGSSKPALFYGRPKVHKPDVPLRPIVSCVGTALYNTSKFLARLLRPLSGKTSSFIRNSADFCEQLREVTIDDDELMVSFDVRSLYTSIPIKEALQVIETKLNEDTAWTGSTSLTAAQIVALLDTCMRKSDFKFRDTFYRMTDGLAMGSPVSAVVANLFMEDFEQRAFDVLTTRPKLWYRFVDDVFTIIKRHCVTDTLSELNARSDHIQFTLELESNGTLPFLDANVRRLPQGKLGTTVYRKPTHTKRYLSFSSHHTKNSKSNVVDALLTRARSIVSDEKQRDDEVNHVRTVLTANGYPELFIKQRELRLMNADSTRVPVGNPRPQPPSQPKTTVSIPFADGTTQAIQRVLRPLDIRVVGRSTPWKWSIQRDIKDATPPAQVTGVVYQILCKNCPASYIGETCRALGIRVKEHLGHAKRNHPELSPVAEHAIEEDHQIDWENPRILDHAAKLMPRRVKEALWISRTQDTMNRDRGLELSPMWIELMRRAKRE